MELMYAGLTYLNDYISGILIATNEENNKNLFIARLRYSDCSTASEVQVSRHLPNGRRCLRLFIS